MPSAIAANLIILSTFVVAAALHAIDPELFYRASQEDQLPEWLTFWAFAVAAVLFFQNAVRDRQFRGGLPWFAVGLGLFCAVVAFEEISWGQRLLGYRPPDYFLSQNFQQELNLHNVVATDLRMAAMQFVLLGYGVALSGFGYFDVTSRWLQRLRVLAPPAALIPSFTVMSAIYAWYPVEYTGEWVECAMGFGFAFAAILAAKDETSQDPLRRLWIATMVIAALSLSTVVGLRILHGSNTERVEAARAEIRRLISDFKSPKLHTRCGIHKRLYTFMQEYNQTHLARGEFASQLALTGEIQRAAFLLDPWNSPYWVRHKCDDGRAVAFVYSLGPNRRRDSSEWQPDGDDIGDYFIGP